MIVRGTIQLKEKYDQLRTGDVVVGMLGLKFLKPAVCIDLLQRGIHCLPSALSQMLSGSKVAQAQVYRKWMPPHTLPICRAADLMSAINHYARLGIAEAVSKSDRGNCGYGIRRWRSIEDLYNQASVMEGFYPFVLQPMISEYTDVRVVMVGDFVDAYSRENSFNFRRNTSLGGNARHYPLSPEQETFCREVLQRGDFPYAHIDLFIFPDKTCRLSEINLNGSIKKGRISLLELEKIKSQRLEKLLEEL